MSHTLRGPDIVTNSEDQTSRLQFSTPTSPEPPDRAIRFFSELRRVFPSRPEGVHTALVYRSHHGTPPESPHSSVSQPTSLRPSSPGPSSVNGDRSVFYPSGPLGVSQSTSRVPYSCKSFILSGNRLPDNKT